MKIALIGYGKMGRVIESMAKDRGHEISFKITSANKNEDWSKCDVAIEFSNPEVVVSNIDKAIDFKVPIVVGTTGWYEDLKWIQERVQERGASLFYASNFSLGVNIFYKVNKHLAQMMSVQKDYKVSIEEIHHTEKLDAPSGTAITLADQITEYHKKYDSWTIEGSDLESSIPIEAKRVNNVNGDHFIRYENDIDSIEIKHSAKNRKGFALGAILAAEFIHGKHGVYTMNDLLNF